MGSVKPAARTGLLENNARPIDAISLHGFEIATVLAEFDVNRHRSGSDAALAPDAEAAQPLYARYWLHNRGPAPLGGLPAVAHLHPHHIATTESELSLRLTAASDCTDAASAGTVELVCPAGWSAVPAALPFALEPGAHLETDISVTMPAGDRAGPLSGARTTDRRRLRRTYGVAPDRRGRLPDHRRRQQRRGTANRRRTPADVVLAAGEDGRLSRDRRYRRPRGPGGRGAPDQSVGYLGVDGPGRGRRACCPGAGRVRLDFAVTPPAWTEPGEWWALVRVAAAGHLLYTPAVRVVGPVTTVAAHVGGRPVPVAEVDAREARLRATSPPASLPLAGTSEARQLRRWLTQLIVTERVVAAEAARLGVVAVTRPRHRRGAARRDARDSRSAA